ncbi:hypothetical protein HDU82_001008, partial [Entophlyctis luteolus]
MDAEIDRQNTATTPATIAELTEAIRALVANQAMLQATITAQQQEIVNLQTRQATVTSTTAPARPLHDFKMPSVKPLEFTGNIKHMPAHQLQNYLDDYLERSLETCRLYNFAPDSQSYTHTGQPTYVQFISSGLTSHARTAWRRVPELERLHMNFENFRNWILTNFGSTLTLAQAVEAMEDLRQNKSAVIYSAQFNELIAAIAAAGVVYPEKHLCIKYLNGLKPHLQMVPDIYRIADDLRKLQQETEKLDDIQFRRARKS